MTNSIYAANLNWEYNEEIAQGNTSAVDVLARCVIQELSSVAASPVIPVQEVAKTPLPGLFQSEFLRRIKLAEKEKIAEEVKKLAPLQPDIIEALHEINTAHPIFKNPQLSLVTLQAYLEGELSDSQAAAIFLWESCCEIDKMTTLHSMRPEDVEASCQLFDHHFHWVDLTIDPDFWRRFAQFLDDEGFPMNERSFFCVKTRIRNPMENEDMHMTLAMLSSKLPIHGAYLDPHSSNVHTPISTLVVPPRLYQAMLNFKFGPQAMQLLPALGYFTKERLSDPHKRVTTIPCSLVTLPRKIHGSICVSRGPGFYLHDAKYHLLVESSNSHRAIWIALAVDVMHRDRMKQIRWLDRDMPDYLFCPGGNCLSDTQKFLKTLADLTLFMETDIKQALKTYICDHSAHWKEEYDLDLTDQEQLNRALWIFN